MQVKAHSSYTKWVELKCVFLGSSGSQSFTDNHLSDTDTDKTFVSVRISHVIVCEN